VRLLENQCFKHKNLVGFRGGAKPPDPHRGLCPWAATGGSAPRPLCKDIGLQRGRFCARSLASCIPSADRSSRMFFIQVVRGRLGGRLQFSGGGSKMAWLASAFSSVYARCPEKVRRRDLMMDESGGWLVIIIIM